MWILSVLASALALLNGGYANMIYFVFDSNGGERVGFSAVRPVVSLKSDVTTDIIPKIADQEEQDWSGFSGGPAQ